VPKSIKELAAGDNITIKLPVDISHNVLAFINQKREVSRNKFLASALIDGLKNKMKEENLSMVTVTLPIQVNEDQRKQLTSPHVERALAGFAQTIIGTGNMPLISLEQKTESSYSYEPASKPNENKSQDFSIYEDMLNPFGDEDED
jgi:hypothetical protein